MRRQLTPLHTQQIARSLTFGRAYSLIAFIGMYLLLWVHHITYGEWSSGFPLYLILGLSLGASFAISFIKSINIDIRVSLLNSNYFIFTLGNLLASDLNQWGFFYVLSAFVATMLTFQTIRSITGLYLLSTMVIGLSAGLLWTGQAPIAIGAPLIFLMLITIVSGTLVVSVQKLTDEQKRFEGEDQLRTKKQALRGVLESTDDLIWSMDRNFNIIEANEAFYSFVDKYVPKEFISGSHLPVGEFFGHNWRNLVIAAFRGEPQKVQIPSSAERPFQLELGINPIYEQGQVVAISGFGRDVSETTELQNKIILAKERYENAAAATQDGIWEWDLANQKIHLSQRLRQILGLAQEELQFDLSKAVSLIHPADLELVTRTFHSLIKQRKHKLVIEVRLKHTDGSWLWMEGRGSVVRNETGRVLRISGALTDISDRKESQLELQKLSLVASHTSNSVIITDADGSVEWVNEAFTRISGYTPEEIIGRRPGPLLQGPETDPEVVSMVSQKLRNGESISTEILNYHKSGKSYWINMEINPIRDPEGNIVNFIANQADITTQKVNELQLRVAKKKAEQAARAKSEFLATMSHEIRTPMNAVIGMTGLLLDSDLTEEQRDFVDTVRISGDNLLTIINDILDFSKIDAGKMDLEQQPFLLPGTVEDVLDLLSSKAQAQNLELTYEADPGVPAQIISDPTRLNQVLVNLIGNAIKFTKEGEVSLTIKEKHRFRNVSQIQFSVRDTGIGIPEEKVQTLFEAFSQVDTSTTREYGGTGLGLAISSRLVQLLGGDIWVESVPGEGSTFHFTIRVKIQNDLTFNDYVVPPKALPVTGQKVLIVDDNHTNLRILQRQLNSWEIEADICDHPSKVGELVRLHQYDLIITDMHMPEIDGLGLAMSLTEVFQENTPPMVMLTSLGQSLKGQARSYFQACLHKPVRREQLYKQIQKILGSNQPQASRDMDTVSPDQVRKMPEISILIAEDNLVNQKVARRMLKKLGYSSEIVANGLEAVEILHRRKFDLVFMDMRMPVMDGLEATRRIREKFSSDQLKIIAMTANAMKGDREECLEAGMDDYVSKPVKIEMIREAILRTFALVPEEVKAT